MTLFCNYNYALQQSTWITKSSSPLLLKSCSNSFSVFWWSSCQRNWRWLKIWKCNKKVIKFITHQDNLSQSKNSAYWNRLQKVIIEGKITFIAVVSGYQMDLQVSIVANYSSKIEPPPLPSPPLPFLPSLCMANLNNQAMTTHILGTLQH